MALVTCYDADGNPRQKEPVDARECCLYCGFSMTPPPKSVEADGDAAETAQDAPDTQPATAKRPYNRKPKS